MHQAWKIIGGILLSGLLPAQNPDSIKGLVGLNEEPTPGFGGGLSFGQVDGDSFITLDVGLSLDLGMVGFGFRVPLRLRVIDEDPEQNDDYYGSIREEDWDEPSDYLRVLRYFRFGHKGDTVHGVVGDLWGVSIGHGTIVNRYYNNIDLDHFRLGFTFDLNTDYGGVETLASRGSQSGVYGGRAHIKPWAFIDEKSWLSNFAIGATLVKDPEAPYQLADSADQPITNVTTQVPDIDDDGYLEVYSEEEALLTGVDAEYQLLQMSLLKLTPYIDYNRIKDAGEGLHLGILATFHLPILTSDLEIRLEHRDFDEDYLPAYFGSHYEIQRYGYPFLDKAGTFGGPAGSEVYTIPKRLAIEHLGTERLKGYYGEANLKVMEWLTVGASYDDYEGENNSNMRAYVSIPALEVLQFKCYYYKHNFEGEDEAFKFDDKSMFLVEGKVPLNSYMSLLAQFWRVWKLDAPTGQYESVDDWSLGLVLNFPF